jgi:predicted deacylase
MTSSVHSDFPGVRLVDALDLAAVPQGTVARLMVQLTHDGMGQSIRVPVLVARGERPGPVFGVTAALHGNEINGIPVIHRLFEWLDPRALRGTLVAVVVANVMGFERRARKLAGFDLNHLFPGQPDGNAPQVYAHRLIDRIVRHFDYLVDLHTASTGRVNSLYVRADLDNPDALRMATLQRPQIILDDPPSDHTLRGHADELGIPAITVEIGNPQRFQHEMIKRSLVGLRAVIAEAGMVPRRKVSLGAAPVVCSSSRWMYTHVGGLLEVLPGCTDRVREGEMVARVTNIFGDPICVYHAPHDGIVIGKSVDPVAETGARILHLGVVGPNQLDEDEGSDD